MICENDRVISMALAFYRDTVLRSKDELGLPIGRVITECMQSCQMIADACGGVFNRKNVNVQYVINTVKELR